MIQKRTMTFGSAQPFSSKWWWMRRHPEDALAGELEGGHLQDDRGGLEHEDAAHHEHHELLAHDHREHAERRADARARRRRP